MIIRLAAIAIFSSLIYSRGFSQETPTSLIDDVSYVYLEKLVAVAKENYPRVKVYESRVNIEETIVKNSKITWLIPLSLSYVYSPTTTLNLQNPTFFSGYQIGFSFNLSSLLQTPGNIRNAKENLKIANLEQDEYFLTLSTEVKRRYFTYLQAVRSLKINSQLVTDAQNAFTMAEFKFNRAELSFTEYNNILIAFSSAKQSKTESEANLLIAKSSLEELLGVRLEQVN